MCHLREVRVIHGDDMGSSERLIPQPLMLKVWFTSPAHPNAISSTTLFKLDGGNIPVGPTIQRGHEHLTWQTRNLLYVHTHSLEFPCAEAEVRPLTSDNDPPETWLGGQCSEDLVLLC
eukprot:3650535-Rhodomonas_salina.2